MGKSTGEQAQVRPPGNTREKIRDIENEAQALYQAGPLEYFPGETYAGLTDPQTAGVNQYINFANQTFPGLSEQIFGSFGNALDAGNLYTDPSVQAGLGVIESQANRNFAENILPQLRQQATGTGNQFSSKAEQSERLAARDLQTAISEAQGQFLGNQLGSARQLQGAGLATAPSVLGTGLFGGQALQNAGGVLQQDLQNQINAAMDRFNFEQQAPGESLDAYANRIAAMSPNVGSTTTSADGSTTAGNMVGGALMGGSLASSMMAAPLLSNPAGWAALAGGAVLGGLLG